MQAIQVTFRHIPHSVFIENEIRRKIHKLSQFYQRINHCRVVVDQLQKHTHQGRLYRVSIDVTVPQKEIVVNRKKSEDLYVAIRDAFLAVEKKLDTYICKKKGIVKLHEIRKKTKKAFRTFKERQTEKSFYYDVEQEIA